MAKKGKVNKDKIYQDIADKLNITEKQVKKAVEHQFQFVHNTIKEGNFDAVRLPYFGVFKVKPRRLEHLRDDYERDD